MEFEELVKVQRMLGYYDKALAVHELDVKSGPGWSNARYIIIKL